MLEFLASILTGASVWLTVRRNILAFPTGILGVLLSAFVLFEAKLYGDMGLQAFFGAMQIHGWRAWAAGEKASDERIAVRRLDLKKWLLGLAAIAVGTVGLGLFLDEKTDSPLPFLDAFLTAASIVAQFWMNWQFLENWILWFVADVIYVPVLWSRGLTWMTALYAVFVAMSVFGFLEWRKKARSS